MTGGGKIVEIQGTAESEPFSRDILNELLRLAEKGIGELGAVQNEIFSGNMLEY
jgi:ribonuclease PH